LSSLIDPLVTEKRLQFRSKMAIEIDARLDTASYGLFANIQPVEFKRVLSNLINNSVEALDEQGQVTISLDSEGDRISLSVEDNGKGIAPDILARLGRKGETHGKVGGSGLGLFHARSTVESWGGRVELDSSPGKGTTVRVRLPKAQPPEWFVSQLDIARGATVVVVDDDTSIHQIWQGRFDSLRAKEHGIELRHFSTPAEFRKWGREGGTQAENVLYLTDYELLGHKETGLDLVAELGIGKRSILVTSRYEEPSILRECLRLNVRMIPKGLSSLVPINVPNAEPETSNPEKAMRQDAATSAAMDSPRPEVVLLDDDALAQMVWEHAAKSKGIRFLGFTDPKEFLAAVADFPKETTIYFDCELGNDVRGEVLAKDLHAQGYTNLYLATGHPADSFPPMAWLKGIVSKSPPWQ
jgi:anti-sigma regulatory factor (Ser/Thr protein kinase)